MEVKSDDYVNIVQNLVDADCDEHLITYYLQLERAGRRKEQLRLLSCHRCTLLREVHKTQKKVDCLDYLIYQVKQKDNRER